MASVSNDNTAGSASFGQQQIEFSYEKAKVYYFEKIGNPRLFGIPLFTREAINNTIEELGNKTMISNEFDVGIREGKKTLLLKSKVPFLQVLPFEDAFDVVIKKHLECDHGDATKTLQLVKQQYSVPTFCLRLAIEACNVCRITSHNIKTNIITKKKLPKEIGKGVWRMYIISYSNTGGSKFYQNHHLLIYKDNETNFVILRALSIKAEEFCLELMKIFLEFGTPIKVVVAYTFEFYKYIFERLHQIRPEVEVMVELGPSDIFEKDRTEVMMEMAYWRKKTRSSYWEIGCHIVQYRMNTTRKYITRLGSDEVVPGIPFNLFFGSEANVYNEIYKDLDETISNS